MQVKLDNPFITGNFKLDISGELNDESTNKFVKSGLVYVVQRDVASKIYKTLLPVEKGEKAPKRNTLDFSDENAEAFKSAAIEALKPYGDFTVSVSQHVPGETATPMVRATNFIEVNLAKDEKSLRAVMALYGAKPDSSKEELIELAHKAGLGQNIK